MTLSGEAVQAVAALAERGMAPEVLEPGKVYAFATGDGQVQLIDLVHHEWALLPERREGVTIVDDVDSFVWLYKRYARAETTEVYAHRSGSVTAVFNAHDTTDGVTAGWGDHGVQLGLRHTDSWQDWTRVSGQPMAQLAFAEFLEDHLPDVMEPAAARLLEVAQTLQGQQRVEWKSSNILKDGTRTLSYAESTDAVSAGAGGQMQVPHEIKLGLRVFEGSPDRYEIPGRFRYQVQSGRLLLTVKLLGMAETKDAAVAATAAKVAEATGATVLWGSRS